jgi:4-hydroxybenzoyl-CoA thioesterase
MFIENPQKELKNSSILCSFQFVNKTDATVLEGEVTLVNVAFNAERNGIKAEPFTEEMKNKIMNYKL